MKLSLKIAVVLIAVVCAALLGHGFFSVKRELALLVEETQNHHVDILRTLRSALVVTWSTQGRDSALALIRTVDDTRRNLRVRWVGRDELNQYPVSVPELMALKSHEAGRFVRKEPNQPRVLFSVLPVVVDEVLQGAIEIAEPFIAEQPYIQSAVFSTALVGTIIAVVSALAALGLGYWQVGKPIGKLIAKARQVGAGDFSAHVALKGNDELATLASEMESMGNRISREIAARLTTMEQLRHSDRLATVGKLSSGIAHELGTPLNVILGRGKMILRNELSREEVMENSEIIVEQTERIAHIIRQLLDFARQRSLKKGITDLGAVVQKTLELLEPLAKKSCVTMQFQSQQQPTIVELDSVLFQQALANIIMNAIQAMPKGGVLSVSIERKQARPPADHGGDKGEFVCLQVRDQGTGMTPEVLEHIFEPFFTTKDVGSGTGLGLAVTYGIVREHGGWIRVKSEVDKGSNFSVYLPQGNPA